MGKRIVALVSLLICGVIFTKIFGANEMGIPLLPLYGFMTGMGLGFAAIFALLFKSLRDFSIAMFIGAWSLFWLSEATLITALLF